MQFAFTKPLKGNELEALVFARTGFTLAEFAVVLGYQSKVLGYNWKENGMSKKAAVLAEKRFAPRLRAHELRGDIFVDPDLHQPGARQLKGVRQKVDKLIREGV